MLRIGQVEATATQDGKYTDGSVAGGIAATRLRAAAFNAMQEELAHIVESAGLALDINDMTQVLKAIQKLTLSRANPFADIKSDGAAAISTALTNLGLGDGTGRLINAQTFTSSGTYTPTAGTKFGIADVVGGGGGGGSNSTTVSAGYASGGQGGGAGSRVVAKLPISGPLSVVVGAGGNGGTPNPSSGNPGGDGGQSSIGGIIATGGRGGAAGAAFNVLPTGANTTSQNAANTIPGGVTLISQHRGKGALSAELYSPNNASSGKGADSDYGFGGPSIAISSGANNAAGVNATGNGAGGSGAVSITGTGTTGVSVAGGNGSAGIVIVWEYA